VTSETSGTSEHCSACRPARGARTASSSTLLSRRGPLAGAFASCVVKSTKARFVEACPQDLSAPAGPTSRCTARAGSLMLRPLSMRELAQMSSLALLDDAAEVLEREKASRPRRKRRSFPPRSSRTSHSRSAHLAQPTRKQLESSKLTLHASYLSLASLLNRHTTTGAPRRPAFAARERVLGELGG